MAMRSHLNKINQFKEILNNNNINKEDQFKEILNNNNINKEDQFKEILNSKIILLRFNSSYNINNNN